MFRHVTLWVIVSFCAGLGLAGLAGASPIVGHYESGTLGGTVLDGRVTEGMTGVLPAVGDELHGASWNGTTLGTQWEITGVKLGAIPTLLWTIPLSTGTASSYRFDYTGGVMNLKTGGPWWNVGDADYLVDVDHYSVTLTLFFDSSAALVSGTSVIEVEGTFQAPYPTHKLVFGSASGVYRGMSPSIKPADYPSFPAGFVGGAWGIVNNMQFDITPEPATLSLLALGGLAMVARRRRRK